MRAVATATCTAKLRDRRSALVKAMLVVEKKGMASSPEELKQWNAARDEYLGVVYKAGTPTFVVKKVHEWEAFVIELGANQLMRERCELAKLERFCVPLVDAQPEESLLVFGFIERDLFKLHQDAFAAMMEFGELVPCERKLDIVGDVVRALLFLHETGLVHRDVKPENVGVTADGSCKLLDFGLLVLSNYTGEYRGTPGYKPPEAINDSEDELEKCDWWAVGILAHEVLTCDTSHGPLNPFDTDGGEYDMNFYAQVANVEYSWHVRRRHGPADGPMARRAAAGERRVGAIAPRAARKQPQRARRWRARARHPRQRDASGASGAAGAVGAAGQLDGPGSYQLVGDAQEGRQEEGEDAHRTVRRRSVAVEVCLAVDPVVELLALL